MKEVKDKDGNTVVLTQTGEYFSAVGKMTISKDGIKTELLSSEDFKDTTPDETVLKIENEWKAEIDEKLGAVIGKADVVFDNYDKDGNRLVRKQSTNSGDFSSDALYYLFDSMGIKVDAAIMNGGGIRNGALTGDLTYFSCKEIHTFGNVACILSVTGQQLLDALEWGSRDLGKAESGSLFHPSGFTYKIDTTIESTVQSDDKGVWTGGPTDEYRVYDVKVFNRETGTWDDLVLDKKYNLAGYNYTLRDLGSGCAMFEGAENILDYVMEDYMVLANYVEAFENKTVSATNSPISQKYENFKIDYSNVEGEGRITIAARPIDEDTDSSDDTETPKPADNSQVAMWVVLMGVSALLVLKSKKHFSR
jgi:2',3'-cyclic-nucleotide 2'-phosphodiesterase (5'-nucleotidase family)